MHGADTSEDYQNGIRGMGFTPTPSSFSNDSGGRDQGIAPHAFQTHGNSTFDSRSFNMTYNNTTPRSTLDWTGTCKVRPCAWRQFTHISSVNLDPASIAQGMYGTGSSSSGLRWAGRSNVCFLAWYYCTDVTPLGRSPMSSKSFGSKPVMHSNAGKRG